MRTMLFRIASVSIALSAAALACAASGDDGPQAGPPLEDGSASSVAEADAPDAAQPDVVAPSDVNVAPSTCSDAGWCVTPLPDPNLTITDIWPLDGHAFAFASTGVIEWDDSVGHWVNIDDGSARDLPNATLANVWAPSKDEVYFTVLARSPKLSASVYSAYLFHGTRSAQGWSWEHVDFGCDVNGSTPQVWGTSHDDVYVWACGSIRHLTSTTDSGADGGDASPWAIEWVDDDPDPFNPLKTLSVTGSGPDDVWFVGVRGELWLLGGGCSVVVRKTAAGYERIVDGQAGFFTTDCTAKPGKTMLTGALSNGINGTFELTGKGRGTGSLCNYSGENDLVSIEATADGGTAVAFAKRPGGVNIRGAWADSADAAWLLVDRSNVGGVIHGTNIWSDAGAYEISTLVRDGVPNITPLWRVRGASNVLWAVGEGYAYRKTTP
jgi:hypothetical protein